jgi:Ca2+/Na+ antiporter
MKCMLVVVLLLGESSPYDVIVMVLVCCLHVAVCWASSKPASMNDDTM